MSLTHETMLELMAFADGELQGEDLVRIERLVAENEEARLTVAAIRSPALGNWLHEEMHERADAAAVDGIADAVMARIEGDGREDAGGVVRLADARTRRVSRVQVGVAAAVVALAAGVALYVRAGSTGAEGQAPVASVATPSVDLQLPPVPPEAVAQGPSQGVEVDEVDSPSHGISVFEIPVGAGVAAANAAGPSSVVIMIEDDQGAK